MMDEPDKRRVVTHFVSEEEEDDADDDGNDDDVDDSFSHPLQPDVSTQVAALSVLLSPVTTPVFHTAGRQNLFVLFFLCFFFSTVLPQLTRRQPDKPVIERNVKP